MGKSLLERTRVGSRWCRLTALTNLPRRCPDPTKAFEALTKALFLDQHLLQFSGSAASSGGGLAVSCAPPSIHLADACLRWSEWLRSAFSQSDFQSLVDLCVGIRAGTFETRAKASIGDIKPEATTSPLELVDIEAAQIEDLTEMRMRPDLVPYRRFLYIGEVSLDPRQRDKLGSAVSASHRLSTYTH